MRDNTINSTPAAAANPSALRRTHPPNVPLAAANAIPPPGSRRLLPASAALIPSNPGREPSSSTFTYQSETVSLGMRIERNPLPEPPWLQVVGILEQNQHSHVQ